MPKNLTPEWRYLENLPTSKPPSFHNSMHHLTSVDQTCLSKPVKVHTKVAIAGGHSKIRFLASTLKDGVARILFMASCHSTCCSTKSGKLHLGLGMLHGEIGISYLSQDSITSNHDPTAVCVLVPQPFSSMIALKLTLFPWNVVPSHTPPPPKKKKMERSASQTSSKTCCQFAGPNNLRSLKFTNVQPWLPYQTPSFESAANP